MKLECISHIGKRMYNALDGIRKKRIGEKLWDGLGVGRRPNRLTGVKMGL